MKDVDLLIAEYNSLRGEIQGNAQRIATMVAFTVTTVSGILGFALQNKNQHLFLVPFLILVPSLLFINSQLISTARISAYLRYFVEPKTEDLNWETCLTGKGLKRLYLYSVWGLYLVMEMMCLVLLWAYNKELIFQYRVFLIITLIITLGAIVIAYRSIKPDAFEDNRKQWNKLIS